MSNFAKPETISLEELKQRIALTDLVPSRAVLFEELESNFEKIAQQGIRTFVDLQKALKANKTMQVFAQATGIDQQYLVLLRREIESYTLKPFKMKEINWIPNDVIEHLVEQGITDSHELLAATGNAEKERALADKTGLQFEMIQYLRQLSDLARVQWVSPLTARMLVEAGYESTRQLALANAEGLSIEIEEVNEGGKYFKGKIGLRDIKRLIHAAGFVE